MLFFTKFVHALLVLRYVIVFCFCFCFVLFSLLLLLLLLPLLLLQSICVLSIFSLWVLFSLVSAWMSIYTFSLRCCDAYIPILCIVWWDLFFRFCHQCAKKLQRESQPKMNTKKKNQQQHTMCTLHFHSSFTLRCCANFTFYSWCLISLSFSLLLLLRVSNQSIKIKTKRTKKIS